MPQVNYSQGAPTDGMTMYRDNLNIEVQDWSDKIHEYHVDVSKFFTLATKGKSMSAISREINWMEYEEADPYLDLSQSGLTAGNLSTNTTSGNSQEITIPKTVALNGIVRDSILFLDYTDDNDHSNSLGTYFRVTDNVEDGSSGWVVKLKRLVKLNATDRYYTSETGVLNNRLTGQSPADTNTRIATHMLSTPLYILHTAKPEAFEDFNPVKRHIENTKNLITTVSNEVLISFHKAAEKWRPNVSQREWQTLKELAKHKKDIERVLMFGVGYDETVSSQRTGVRQMTKGLFDFGLRHCEIESEDFDYKSFCRYIMDFVMPYNDKEEMTGWCNPAFLQAVIEMIEKSFPGQLSLMNVVSKNEFGMNIRKLMTPHCTINLIVNTCLKERFGDKPFLLVCDMDKISTRYLAGNGENLSTKIEKDIQIPSATYHLDRIWTTVGLQVEGAKSHTYLKVI